MALTKEESLRKVEFIFTDDKVHSVVHCTYSIVIDEDGTEILRKNYRQNETLSDMKTLIAAAEEFVPPDPE